MNATPDRSAARDELPGDMRAEVRLLGTALGRILAEAEGDELFADVEALRELTITAAEDPEGGSFARAEDLVASFAPDRAHQVARAFTVYFLLTNLAEERQRVRALRRRAGSVPLADQRPTDSLAAAVRALAGTVGPDDARAALDRLRFHPVLTAHPTEARRTSISAALGRVAGALDDRSDPRSGPAAVAAAEDRLMAEVDTLWRTAQLRVNAPSPLDEVHSALRVVDSSFISVVLDTYARLAAALREEDGAAPGEVPADAPGEAPADAPAGATRVPAFARLGSWIGGDRDGNPFVTAATTREAVTRCAELALNRHARATRDLARSLTLSDRYARPSAELARLVAAVRTRSEDAYAESTRYSPQETHRVALLLVAQRLEATLGRDADLAYAGPEEAIEDLRVVQRSLVSAGVHRTAHGDLQRVIWSVQTFGFHLTELEVRQHSKVHAAALAHLERAGAPGAGAGGPGEQGAGAGHAAADPLPAPPVDPEEVLATFRAIAWARQRFGPRAAGRYIVSFTTSAADIEAVYRLAAIAAGASADGSAGEGVGDGADASAGAVGTPAPEIDVVPLFETHDDLRSAPSVLAEMVTLPQVRARLAANGNRLEVMLGYSDSAKDVGPVAATLALADAQRELTAWARAEGIELTLFHGRGGALGRGGGPAHRALLAQPAGSVDLRFKVTEQGEVINARYANPDIAARHVEQVASAALLAGSPSLAERDQQVAQRFARLRATLAEVSRERFHELVHANGFAPWFAQVTPQEEIGLLSLGSRPARRGLSVESLEDLRAIPWNFAWTQARINLTAWFGLGSAFEAVGDVEELRAAYREWPLLTTLVDNVEMSLAKSDPRIAERYLQLGSRDDLADLVRTEDALTRRWVRAVTGHSYLLEGHPILGRAVALRNPYVDALSLLQLRALRTLRGGGAGVPDESARELLLLTLKGVAAGLQNTG